MLCFYKMNVYLCIKSSCLKSNIMKKAPIPHVFYAFVSFSSYFYNLLQRLEGIFQSKESFYHFISFFSLNKKEITRIIPESYNKDMFFNIKKIYLFICLLKGNDLYLSQTNSHKKTKNMKRQLFFALAACCCSTFAFAQLKVVSNGSVSIPNRLSLDWIAGIRGQGVLNVTSSRVHPEYNSALGDLPTLICTQSLNGMYPYVNYTNNKVTFRVAANGQVYSAAGFVQTSDSICKENIAPLPSTLTKIRSLRGVTFDYRENAENQPEEQNELQAAKAPALAASEVVSGQEGNVVTPSPVPAEVLQQIEEEKSRKRIGLIAQEVEKVYPEVVRTQPDGNKGIYYSDLVAVLVEAVKELQDSLSVRDLQMKALEERLANVENRLVLPAKAPRSVDGGKEASGNLGQGEAVLYQNTPNPFNRETEISYRLSSDTRSAFICIYNLNGQQLKKYPVPVSSLTGKITVSGSELQAGMYIYALVIDNEVMDSKRMTLTD